MAVEPEGLPPPVDVRDLNSVRRALRTLLAREQAEEGGEGRPPSEGRRGTPPGGEVILGDDWVAAQGSGRDRPRSLWRSLVTLQRSPLARKIITFNLIALILLVLGMLWLTTSRDSLAFQRAQGLLSEAELVADVVEARLPPGGAADLSNGAGSLAAQAFEGLTLRGGSEAYLFDGGGRLVATASAPDEIPVEAEGGTAITDALNAVWEALASLLSPERPPMAPDAAGAAGPGHPARPRGPRLRRTGTWSRRWRTPRAHRLHRGRACAARGEAVGVVAVRSAAGEIDALVRREREQVLRMFVVGRDRVDRPEPRARLDHRQPAVGPRRRGRIGARPQRPRHVAPARPHPRPVGPPRRDRAAVGGAARHGRALYERIEANEQFAADVAHEIKNPLASLRSAVGTLHVAKRDDQRQKLLEIIEHDVSGSTGWCRTSRRPRGSTASSSRRRSGPSTSSRCWRPRRLPGRGGAGQGDRLHTDLPPGPVVTGPRGAARAGLRQPHLQRDLVLRGRGRDPHLGPQARQPGAGGGRGHGPGIPEDALQKIFQRFYSERPEGQFGNNSGLGSPSPSRSSRRMAA
jgi:two-component system sensor histidine kinase ChvG